MKIVQTGLIPRNREFILWGLMILVFGAYISELIRFQFVFGPELFWQSLVTGIIVVLFGFILISNRRLGKTGRWYLLVEETGLKKIRPSLWGGEIVMAKMEFAKCLKLEIVEDWFAGECLRAEIAFSRKAMMIPIGQYEKTPMEIWEICQRMMEGSNKNS
jgi:hypothetical protein